MIDEVCQNFEKIESKDKIRNVINSLFRESKVVGIESKKGVKAMVNKEEESPQ